MKLIENILNQAIQEFVAPHPCLYNFAIQLNDQIKHSPNLSLQFQQLETSVKQGQAIFDNKIRLNIIKNKSNQDNIILYLHGLSSYCLEGKFLVDHLKNNYSLCLFDSRGHGKNQEECVTFGLIEAQQLWEIIKALVARGYNKVILWGRSMGAVTCLRVMQKYSNHPEITNVKYVIADSPFSSFKAVAMDMISKRISLPSFLEQLIAESFIKRIEEKFLINLEEIDLQHLELNVPIKFLKSEKDEVISSSNLNKLLNTFKSQKEVIELGVLHNDERPITIVKNIFKGLNKIFAREDYLKQSCILTTRKKGVGITKYDMLQSFTPNNRLSEKTNPAKKLKVSLHFYPNVSQCGKQNNNMQSTELKRKIEAKINIHDIKTRHNIYHYKKQFTLNDKDEGASRII